MRRFLLIGSLVVVTAVLALLLMANRFGYASSRANASGVESYPSPTPVALAVSPKSQQAQVPLSRPEGVPAITPPVTEASVRAYLANEKNQMVIGHGRGVRVTSVQLMTASQLRDLLHDAYLNNFPADMPVAYVSVTGDFEDETPLMHTGYAVFDAQTGNVLITGAK